MQFFDLNIPYLESDKNVADKKNKRDVRLKTMARAVELGYSGVAFNHTIKGAMSQSDGCTISRFPISSLLKLHTSLSYAASFHRRLLGVPLTDAFRQYTRLTVVVETDAHSSALNSGNPVLKTYDLVAVSPLNQSLFDHACQSAQVDMICIDFGKRLPFRLKLSSIKAAIQRGVYFEIMYSRFLEDAQVRRQLISSAKLLVEWTRGKNLVVSSAAPSSHEIRGPNDVSNLLNLLGLSNERAKAAISKNCRLLIASALRKKQFYKEAIRVELLPPVVPTDPKEPWIADYLNWDPLSSGEGDLLLEDLAKSFADSGKASQTIKSINFTSLINSVPSHVKQGAENDSEMEARLHSSSNAVDFRSSSKDLEVPKATWNWQQESASSSMLAEAFMMETGKQAQEFMKAEHQSIDERNSVDNPSLPCVEVTKEHEQNEEHHSEVKTDAEESQLSDSMMQLDSSYQEKYDINSLIAKSTLAEELMMETTKQVQEFADTEDKSIVERNSGNVKVKRSVLGPVLRFPFKRLLQLQFKRKGRTSMYKTKKRVDKLLVDCYSSPPLEVACTSCGSMFLDVEKLGRHHCSRILDQNKAVIDDDDDDNDDDDEEEEFDAEKFHEEAWCEGGIYECQARVFAEASLRYLDRQTDGKKYELVKLGSFSAATTFCGPLIHANFKAKAKDCPAAPVETLFTQLRQNRGLAVDCCVSLGPSEELPYWENADLHGCKYCRIPIHHPAKNLEKLIKTRHDNVSWLYGDHPLYNDSSSSESD